MNGQINDLKSIFEFEIKRKLGERARSPASEFRILMNCFKFYDFDSTGKLNQNEFVKGVLRTGLSGFNESDIRSLFSCYDVNNTGYFDYKNFCNYLYGREPLKPLSNSQAETQNQTDISQNSNLGNNIQQQQSTTINNDRIPKTPLNQNTNLNSNVINNNQNNQNIAQNQNINQIQPEQNQNQQNLDPNQTKEYFQKLILSIKDQIHTNNGLTYYNFLFELKNNSEQNQNISLENFVNTCKNIGLNIPQNDIINLFSLLDFSQTGKINIDDIMNTIVDQMNEHRKLFVVNKFSKMDIEKQGEVKVSLLKEKYNPKGHPDVVNGKISEEEIYKQFCYTLDIYCSLRNINDIINYKQFIDYYNGISSAILDENYFENILNGVWDENNININNNKDTNIINNINNNNNFENIPQKTQQINNQINNNNQNAQLNNNNIEENKNLNNNNIGNQNANNGEYNNQQNRRYGRKNNNNDENSYSTSDIGINSLFLGESKNVLPKRFGRRNFKRYRPNFNPQNPDNYNNNINMNQNNNININQNNVQINNNSNNFIQNNNRNNYNKTPIIQSQTIQVNKTNNTNNYNDINNFNNFMNNDKGKKIKLNFNPITNEYIPNKEFNTIQNDNLKTPLNQNNFKNDNNVNNINNNINNNSELNSTNNTLNQQNNDEQIKEIIINSLNKLKSIIIYRGCRILFSFQRKLSLYDIKHQGLISFNNFLSVAQVYSLNLSIDELKLIFDLFDKEKTGYINYNELIQIISGPLSPNRQEIIKKLYDSFNKDSNGKVSINEIKLLFNSRRHPDVINGKKSEGEIFGEFLDNIESFREYLENLRGVYDNNLNLEDFYNFYNEIGIDFEDDKMFEFMINNCWNLNNNNNYDNNMKGANDMNNTGNGVNRYRNNNNSGYKNNFNNNSSGGNLIRAGSQIISNQGF